MEKSSCIIIRRFNSHHIALADNLDVNSSCPSPNIECLLISSWTLFHVFLVDFQLGRCAVGKSFCRNYQKKLSSTAQRPRLLLVNYTLPLSSLFFATMQKQFLLFLLLCMFAVGAALWKKASVKIIRLFDAHHTTSSCFWFHRIH